MWWTHWEHKQSSAVIKPTEDRERSLEAVCRVCIAEEKAWDLPDGGENLNPDKRGVLFAFAFSISSKKALELLLFWKTKLCGFLGVVLQFYTLLFFLQGYVSTSFKAQSHGQHTSGAWRVTSRGRWSKSVASQWNNSHSCAWFDTHNNKSAYQRCGRSVSRDYLLRSIWFIIHVGSCTEALSTTTTMTKMTMTTTRTMSGLTQPSRPNIRHNGQIVPSKNQNTSSSQSSRKGHFPLHP